MNLPNWIHSLIFAGMIGSAVATLWLLEQRSKKFRCPFSRKECIPERCHLWEWNVGECSISLIAESLCFIQDDIGRMAKDK